MACGLAPYGPASRSSSPSSASTTHQHSSFLVSSSSNSKQTSKLGSASASDPKLKLEQTLLNFFVINDYSDDAFFITEYDTGMDPVLKQVTGAPAPSQTQPQPQEQAAKSNTTTTTRTSRQVKHNHNHKNKPPPTEGRLGVVSSFKTTTYISSAPSGYLASAMLFIHSFIISKRIR